MSEIKNPQLAKSGHQKIDWVTAHMPVLTSLKEDFAKTKPFAGKRVALSIHMEAKTAYLATVLAAGGAEVYATGSNVLSTQDDVAAALAERGVEVFAWHAATPEEYDHHLKCTLSPGPHIIIDDGGDLVNMMHNDPDLTPCIDQVIGGCEETTTGIIRLKAMDRDKALRFPMMLVNNAQCKFLFDNRYGTGQSVWNAINKATNLIVAGKTVVVAGYGWCGKGVAMRAKALGANVIITEVDPIKACEAVMDGYRVMPMEEAAPEGDVLVTVTGCADVIGERHFPLLKDGAILCNAGHFNVEVNVAALEQVATAQSEARANIIAYTLPNGRTVYVIGEGRLVNLAAGDGHPAEIMDMSFSIQSLAVKHLIEHAPDKIPGAMTHEIPSEIDREVATRKLRFLGCAIDTLTPEQATYLDSWNL